ncbi:MAG: O-methyltransferase [Planctomycetes bacterium]|nr:O-methyltransferase [Planctomycetota bacterium]
MPNSPDHKSYAAEDPAISGYVERVFGAEDEVLADIRRRAAAAGLPAIHVSPFDGRHMEVIARAAGAKKIVEIGTLAGYSGVNLARALPADGVLHTFEFEPKHAEVAKESFRRAGVNRLVEIHVGAALEKLPHIENVGPFDLVFIDADKENYPNYLAWAAKHLRVGGVVLVDNAFAWGLLTLPENDEKLKDTGRRSARTAIDSTNRALNAAPGFWRSTMLPTGEGLAMGVKTRA